MQRHHCIQRTSLAKQRPLSFLHPERTHLFWEAQTALPSQAQGQAPNLCWGTTRIHPTRTTSPLHRQSRISVNASWKHQHLPHFSKLDTYFPSSPARRASGSSPCPAMPHASAGLQRGSQPSAALQPLERTLHNHSTDLPSTAVRRHPGRNREPCFPLPKAFSLPFAHLLAPSVLLSLRQCSAAQAGTKNYHWGLLHVINLA